MSLNDKAACLKWLRAIVLCRKSVDLSRVYITNNSASVGDGLSGLNLGLVTLNKNLTLTSLH